MACRRGSVWLLILGTLLPTVAAAQATINRDVSANSREDFLRPPQSLFQLLYEYETAPGSGSTAGSIGTVTTDEIKLRADHRVDLSQQLALALRADLPLVAKDPVTSGNPTGDYLYGIGDADTQAALVDYLDKRWTVGFGARLTEPTGGDTLGSGKWQIMPLAGARYDLSEINSGSYVEPLVRYDVSFAGDPSKKNISNLQIAPTFNLGLPYRMFLTLYPSADIRVNFGDPVTGQTGRLFLPFDAEIGGKLTDNLVLSLEVGVPIVKDYPVYNFQSRVRLNLTY